MTISYGKNCKLLNVTGYRNRLLSIKLTNLKIKKEYKTNIKGIYTDIKTQYKTTMKCLPKTASHKTYIIA